MIKPELRKKYKALRLALNEVEIEQMSIKIANQALQLPIWNKEYYHLFLPIMEQREVDTRFILSILQGRDKAIVISKSDFNNHTLAHYLLTDATMLKNNNYGIPEPVEGIAVPVAKIEAVFVPLLAFDIKGNRVGYGKGFYDTFLAECKKETLKIGLSFFEAEAHIDAVVAYDVPLDYCITPYKIYDFS